MIEPESRAGAVCCATAMLVSAVVATGLIYGVFRLIEAAL